MADLIPPMLIKLQADVSELKVGLAQAENALKGVDSSVKTASTGMNNFMSQMKKVGATMGVAFAGQQIVQFGKDVIMAASDMNESLGKVSVVFGNGTQEVVNWSKTSAQAMGLSSQKALEAAGTYGNLFQAFGMGQGEAQNMSTSLVQLASDMASFNNTSIDDAILALRSGLSGETEPLKKFGVAMNDVRLKEQAMSMGLIKTTSGVLPPLIKAQAAYALIMHDTQLAQGDYARTADGAANTMRTLQAEFQNAKVALGNALLPAFRALLAVLKLIVPMLTAIGTFFTENADALKVFAILVGGLTTAFYGYKAALVAVKVAQELFVVIQTLMKGATLASIASTNGLAASMIVLNKAMRANPIGLIITGLMVLGAAFVWAWKKSETFRGIVIKGAQIILNAFAYLVQGIGKFIGMLSKVPGMGWAKGIADGAKAASEAIKTTSKNLSDLKTKGAGYGEGAFTYGSGGGTGGTGGTGGASGGGKGKGGITPADQKKLDGYLKTVKGIYADIDKAIADAQDKAQKALDARNDKMIKAHKDYDEKVASLNKDFNERIDAAQKAYDEKTLDINKTFDKRKIELEKDLQKKLADLKETANKKSADLTQAAADKQASIIKQSVDRLRNAFASKTGFDIAEAFGGGATAGDAIAKLKDTLQAAKELQGNAAKLAGMGYSQVFIEEVVKNGPEAGNSIAEALMKASPEATKELQDLYNQVENVSNHGLDNLAKTMNAGAHLATQELLDAYSQVSIDLQTSLAEVDADLLKSMAEANAAYQEAMTEAKTVRDEGLADALKTFTEAKAEAQKILDEGLIEAQKTLMEALTEAQKAYEDAIDEINKATMEKIAELQAKLAEVVALIASISAAQAAAAAAAASTYVPIVPTTTPTTPTSPTTPTNPSTSIVQNFTTTKVDPYDVHLAVVSGVKYGEAITMRGYSGKGALLD